MRTQRICLKCGSREFREVKDPSGYGFIWICLKCGTKRGEIIIPIN